MAGGKHVTSIDVAAEAGVSQATVARSFSSPELVAVDTLSKVEAAAARLGYVPNAIARSLKSQRTHIIGAMFPASGEYWQHVLTSFSRQLGDRRHQLLLFSFTESGEVPEVLKTIEQYRVDGLILASTKITQAQLASTSAGGAPRVAFNQPAASGVVPSVSVDNDAGARLLAQHLVEQGCRSAIFVGGSSQASTDQIRYRAAAQAFGDNAVALPYLEAGDFSYEAGYKIAGHLADRASLPDAVMVAGDELAFGVVDGLANIGVTAPNDLLLTGFDGLPQASWAAYDLTTLTQPTDSLVERTVDHLLSSSLSTPIQAPTIETPGVDPGDLVDPIDIVVAGALRLGRTTQRSAQGASHG